MAAQSGQGCLSGRVRQQGRVRGGGCRLRRLWFWVRRWGFECLDGDRDR